MSAADYVYIESPQFGRTGPGLLPAMRANDDEDEALAYSIDAPVFIAQGSLRTGKGGDYVHTTTARPGGLW